MQRTTAAAAGSVAAAYTCSARAESHPDTLLTFWEAGPNSLDAMGIGQLSDGGWRDGKKAEQFVAADDHGFRTDGAGKHHIPRFPGHVERREFEYIRHGTKALT
jgi:hypothetical protein